MKYLKTYEQHEDKSLITVLNLSYKNLTELPDLSEYINLKILYCDNNELTSLPELPDSLKELYCENNQLTSFLKLPDSLKKLTCYNNKLTSLPELPDSLLKLDCENNQLQTLPDLPKNLKDLWCDDNQLRSLPELPVTLKFLNCYNNQLPFDNLYEYEEWYKANKYMIYKNGLEYVYQLYNNINKYNL